MVEGIAQSLLPCSWIIVLTAFVVGLGATRLRTILSFSFVVMFAAWAFISGWVNPPLWIAGFAVLGGGLAWWRWGPGTAQTAAVGVGSVWAWQPCVGRELGAVLSAAQTDPIAALPGIVGFVTGLLIVGLGLGLALGWWLRRRTGLELSQPTAIFFIVLGLLMVSGLWASVASFFAMWSTKILA